ncbi:DNA-binding transcriptional regulator, MerR family [Streptococcus equinus]|uniref:DNA-binding transcriptional regulator, MerR family n=1 Tax=Streptococcus equinus TaxID=1335 RepID=A0A1H0YU36_STREI|nr:MerR family transcriptional regulator [Streptococcus equinus]SDQ18737.1 DNA-binding transcriptional regulator, MerR family [Streptococcus equinus]
MLKISEFAKLAKTTRRTLIFYDKKGIFSPAKTGENGYRFYEADQLYRFELICGLRQLGIPLNKIKFLLESKGQELEKYLSGYQLQIREEIKRLQYLEQLLEQQKEVSHSYETMLLNQVSIEHETSQQFWCSEREVDCMPEDIARLYATFMNELGDVASINQSQTGFLTELALSQGENYMAAPFRFIKARTELDSKTLSTYLEKPEGDYLSIKVETSLEGILKGIKLLNKYAQENNIQVIDRLWQLNCDHHLIKNGSSAQQILQYQIVEGD